MFTLLKLPSRELVSPDEEVYMSESRADRIARLSAVLPDKTVEQLENLTKEQDEKFIDAKGRELLVGSRVRLAFSDDADEEDTGVVLHISDGRTIVIAPKVTVKFGDGIQDKFSTHYTGCGYESIIPDPWQCDDLKIVNGD